MLPLFIDELFDWCVRVLLQGAHTIGMTYKEINVWIFCIIEPIVFFVMLYIIIRQRKQLKKLTNK